jgi:hypothetical protein
MDFFRSLEFFCAASAVTPLELRRSFASAQHQALGRLDLLAEALKGADSSQDKLGLLNQDPLVRSFLMCIEEGDPLFAQASVEEEVVMKAMIAIGLGESLFATEPQGQARDLLVQTLLKIEQFYAPLGGIVGYQRIILSLLKEKEGDSCDPAPFDTVRFLPPEGIDLSDKTPQVVQAIAAGIERMGELAEIYVVGGAADRLRSGALSKTLSAAGWAPPAARLCFAGKTLLQTLVIDVQAREYLYFKLFHKQLLTPLALMTSLEKGNHQQIVELCEEQNWFGRPKESFFLFCQPSVPTFDREGNWCMAGPWQLLLKPGGHGVIWKLAKDSGVFEWLEKQGRKKALVRQINNPIAGVDDGLLAFTGLGFEWDKVFGFASCPRQIRAAEGINVLVEKRCASGFSYSLRSIEYCDFKKYQISDEPASLGSLYSQFPSNTNILFVDLASIAKIVDLLPIPGGVINFKKTEFQTPTGEMRELEIARLESTMQNIADALIETFSEPRLSGDDRSLKTFLTYNKRHKTISTVKREYSPGSSLLETPEGCFWDLLRNAEELLKEHCHMELPPLGDLPPSLGATPPFLLHYHPALGPLYSVISQKIRRGKIEKGSSLELWIADVDIEELTLDGALSIVAECVMGKTQEVLSYGAHTGKCELKNVKVVNAGIDRSCPQVYWRGEIQCIEKCEIFLEGDGEFCAEDVTLVGAVRIVVPSGMRVRAVQDGAEIRLSYEKLTAPSWEWQYRFAQDRSIQLYRRR